MVTIRKKHTMMILMTQFTKASAFVNLKLSPRINHRTNFHLATASCVHSHANGESSIENNTPPSSSPTIDFVHQVTSWLETEQFGYKQMTLNGAAAGPVLGLVGKSLQNKDDSEFGRKFSLILHLLPTPQCTTATTSSIPKPTCTARLTDDPSSPALRLLHHPTASNLIHLHQDVWSDDRRGDIVRARLAAKLGKLHKDRRYYARNTVAKRIDSPTAVQFLQSNHLWGATRAKFNYGLFARWNKRHAPGGEEEEEEEEELVAVATFSPRRHVNRNGSRLHRSHELIRYCSLKDGHVAGGISKLLAAFCRDHAPDDIVTCIDRDWGDGQGWAGIGFEKVQVMPPLVMAVESKSGLRRYLVGAGIGKTDDPDGSFKTSKLHARPGVAMHVLEELNNVSNEKEAYNCLISNNLIPVYDAGVERRMLLIQESKLLSHSEKRMEELGILPMVLQHPRELANGNSTSVVTSTNVHNSNLASPNITSHETNDHVTSTLSSDTTSLTLSAWQQSTPSFPDKYYSSNYGINLLLEAAARLK